MLKILFAACFGRPVVNSVQFALEMCLAAQNRKTIYKKPILMSLVIGLGVNRKPVYDFLLVINGVFTRSSKRPANFQQP